MYSIAQISEAFDITTTAAMHAYRGTSLMRKRTPLGPYRRPMPGVLGGSYEGGRFFMGEVPLYYERSLLHVERPITLMSGQSEVEFESIRKMLV